MLECNKKHVLHLKLEVHTHVCLTLSLMKQTFANMILCYNLFNLFKQVEHALINKNTHQLHQLLSNFNFQVTSPTSRLATIGDNKAFGPHLLVTFTKSRKIRPKVCACGGSKTESKTEMSLFGASFDLPAPWFLNGKPWTFPGNDPMPNDASADFVVSGNCKYLQV